ncbi:subtilisin-like protein [Trichodelitschia bisporula]|uniref:Subtilisin-like protein n=1 Tax=Trichodelitschia bisporula TaxID=703511 RepID=A0A6G1I979_9PEZI|nr:subtilisin-like protein [Trichodelitschia bisporula]
MLTIQALLTLVPFVLAAPLIQPRAAETIPGKYIVVLKPNGPSAGEIFADLAGGALASVRRERTYDLGGFKGFAASLSDAQVEALKGDSKVAYIEADGIAHTQAAITQSDAPWGLGRISHRSKGVSDYAYDTSAGEGTCAYIVDTGIYAEHPEFEGRATFVKDVAGSATTDDNGHGTHVAGTIGSRSYGVAKKTKLYGIKVLDSSGSGAWSDIVTGIQLAVSHSKTQSCPKGVVVNMSLGGGKQQSVNDAVAAAVDAGLFFAVAAGNDGQDFSSTSPASEPKAFAVGASDVNDKLASFSNYGRTLGVIAPGVNVLSTWNDGGNNTISGTSMATPHVAGLGAYLLGLSGPLTPAQLKSKIQSSATSGAISITYPASLGTPNKLAYNGIS